MIHGLRPRTAGRGRVETTAQGWRLVLPPGPGRTYHLAQLDDYTGRPRRAFPHRAPVCLRARVRVQHPHAAGTWGLGWWNDPFGLGLGFGGGLILPAWPQAAWFFYAAPANSLSFWPARAPARGFFAGTVRGCRVPAWALILPAALALPGLLFRGAATALRALVARCVRQDGVALNLDPTVWHTYTLNWRAGAVSFGVDGHLVSRLPAPRPPLGLVLWVDNQFAAWEPGQRPRWGVLPTPEVVVMEVEDVEIIPDPCTQEITHA